MAQPHSLQSPDWHRAMAAEPAGCDRPGAGARHVTTDTAQAAAAAARLAREAERVRQARHRLDAAGWVPAAGTSRRVRLALIAAAWIGLLLLIVLTRAEAQVPAAGGATVMAPAGRGAPSTVATATLLPGAGAAPAVAPLPEGRTTPAVDGTDAASSAAVSTTADAAGAADAVRPSPAVGATRTTGTATGTITGGTGSTTASPDDFDFFSDKPVTGSAVVAVPEPPPAWQAVGGPVALLLAFLALNVVIWRLVPFAAGSYEVNLRRLPPAVKRGMAMAVIMFGIAFTFGAFEISYQLGVHGSAEAYFAQMTVGKLIAFTHAHLFGFTTSFFIVGIPFSLQFNHLKSYQWVFPVGLAASVTDVASWWGIKFVSPNFEWVSIFCGVLFTVSYLWMLIGLLRVLLFPEVIWASDKDRAERLAARVPE